MISRCATCNASLDTRSRYHVASETRCLACALRYRPMLRRSLQTAMVVGTVLVGINHGAAILDAEFARDMIWQIPLNYVVPFSVATWGALGNCREAPRRK